MNRKLILLAVSIMHVILADCQPPSTSSSSFVAQAFDHGTVKLLPSAIKEREALNTTYIHSLDPDRLLHNFRVNAGISSIAKPLSGWEDPKVGLRGHFVGHYLSSAAVLIKRYGDSALLQKVTYVVAQLYECQLKLGNGYLSAFSTTDFDRLESTFGGVWAPYYTYHKIMQGLLDVYLYTHNTQALKIVEKMASYVSDRMSMLDAVTIEKMLYTVGANPSNEAGAMNEVLYNLYKVTHNPEHLALAKVFDRDWLAAPLSKNHDILSGLHANTHLVLVNGFAERYNVTADNKYRNAALNFWHILQTNHVYVNGSSSGPRPNVTTGTSLTAEHWGLPNHLSNTMTTEIAESCVSHNTQKLTATLFKWTAQPKYAEVYSNTFFNAILPLQSRITGSPVYHLPLSSPRKKKFLTGDDFRCCNGSSIEAFASLDNNIYFKGNQELWVNLYIPSELNWAEKGMLLKQSGSFQEDGKVRFKVEDLGFPSRLKVNFFIPSWAEATSVYVNDVKQSTGTNSLCYYTLKRQWKKGDIVEIEFKHRFHIYTMSDDPNTIAIFYGPNLLAFETSSEVILESSPAQIIKNLSASGHTFTLSDGGRTYSLRPFHLIEDESYGVYATIKIYK